MNAQDIMSRPVVAAAPTATARDVAIYMLLGGFSGVPITERDGRVVGIVTELDLMRAVRAGKTLETTTVSEIMSDSVIAVDVRASVEEVMDVLDSERILRVPVMKDGKMVGVVSRPDVLRALIETQFIRFD